MGSDDLFSREPVVYELRFEPLSPEERVRCFPCGDDGCVDLDALSSAQRLTYLYARALIGKHFQRPAVHRLGQGLVAGRRAAHEGDRPDDRIERAR